MTSDKDAAEKWLGSTVHLARGARSEYLLDGFLAGAAHVRKEAEGLRADLALAIQYLREGKARFAPNTTNSLVDDLIAKWEAKNE